MALHQREVLIVELALALEAAGFQEDCSHGASGGEAHPAALARSAVVLAQIGHGELEQRLFVCR